MRIIRIARSIRVIRHRDIEIVSRPVHLNSSSWKLDHHISSISRSDIRCATGFRTGVVIRIEIICHTAVLKQTRPIAKEFRPFVCICSTAHSNGIVLIRTTGIRIGIAFVDAHRHHSIGFDFYHCRSRGRVVVDKSVRRHRKDFIVVRRTGDNIAICIWCGFVYIVRGTTIDLLPIVDILGNGPRFSYQLGILPNDIIVIVRNKCLWRRVRPSDQDSIVRSNRF